MEYYEWFATTVTGLEDLAAREVEELINTYVQPDIGKVFFRGGVEHASTVNYASTLINRVYLLLAREKIESLDDVYRIARKLDYSWIIDPYQTFAVRAERHDKQLPFTSIDAAATIGRAIIESYESSKNTRVKVNLDDPDLEFYCLLRGSEMLLGLNITGRSLHRRYYRLYAHRAGLQPTIASAMIKISRWRQGEGLLDPMCGSGTIPIEAAIKVKNIPPGLMRGEARLERLKFIDQLMINELKKKIERNIGKYAAGEIVGSDASEKSIEGARRNLEAAKVSDIVKLMVGNCLRLEDWLSWEPPHIVTNPPYGIRMSIKDVAEFYRRFVESIRKATPYSKLTIIVSKPKALTTILEEKNYTVRSMREVLYGGLRVTIISAER